jgi:hypothetical protein
MCDVRSGPNESRGHEPRAGIDRRQGSRRRRVSVGRWAALALAVASLVIPAGAAAYFDGGGPASQSTGATQFPTANQIAEHRGNPTQELSAKAPTSDGKGHTVVIVLAVAAVLGTVGVGAVSVASRARAHRAPQPSV